MRRKSRIHVTKPIDGFLLQLQFDFLARASVEYVALPHDKRKRGLIVGSAMLSSHQALIRENSRKELKLKKALLAAAALLAATWSMSSAATSFALVCNGCTQQETRQMVQGSEQGDYFVYDMLNRKITHWSVTGTDPDSAHLANVPITASVQNYYSYVQQLYDSTGTLNPFWVTNASAAVVQASANVLHTSTKVMAPLAAAGSAPGSPLSAYDTINTPVNQNAAIAAATGWGTWGQAGSNLEAGVAAFASHFTPGQILIPMPVIISQQLTLADGSSIVIHFDVNDFHWHYTTGSAKDSTGNPIPENPDQAAGGSAQRQNYIWSSTPNGINDALRATQNFLNLGLDVGTPVFRAGGTWTVACVRVGGPDGSVSCTGTPT